MSLQTWEDRGRLRSRLCPGGQGGCGGDSSSSSVFSSSASSSSSSRPPGASHQMGKEARGGRGRTLSPQAFQRPGQEPSPEPSHAPAACTPKQP